MIQQKSTLHNLIILALLVIAAWLIYLGISKSMLPPLLSGIGFLLLSVFIFMEKTSKQ